MNLFGWLSNDDDDSTQVDNAGDVEFSGAWCDTFLNMDRASGSDCIKYPDEGILNDFDNYPNE